MRPREELPAERRGKAPHVALIGVLVLVVLVLALQPRPVADPTEPAPAAGGKTESSGRHPGGTRTSRGGGAPAAPGTSAP